MTLLELAPGQRRFVSVIPVSLDGREICLLLKNRGPKEIVGKVTFSGGGSEPSDVSLAHGAKRELFEETGVDANVEDFVEVFHKLTKNGPLHVFFVVADLSVARTMEDEVVIKARVSALLAAAQGKERGNFAPDFLELFEPALGRIQALEAANPIPLAPARYIAPYLNPAFSQSLQRERPHELVNHEDSGLPMKLPPSKRGNLLYRYRDTGEVTLVPNVGYNATVQMRTGDLRFEAQRREEHAERLRTSLPADWHPLMASELRVRLLKNAESFREVAKRIEDGTSPFDTSPQLVSEASMHRSTAEQMARELAAAAAAPGAAPGTATPQSPPAPRRNRP